jgi:hypothetical protein
MAADEPAGPPPATAKSKSYPGSAPVITLLKYHCVNVKQAISLSLSLRTGSRQSDSNRRPADYKSAALPAELCRHLPGKIPSDASSASVFLYAFSIQLRSTPIDPSFRIRPQRTGANSHRFGVPATTHPLRAWSGRHACSGNTSPMRRSSGLFNVSRNLGYQSGAAILRGFGQIRYCLLPTI